MVQRIKYAFSFAHLLYPYLKHSIRVIESLKENVVQFTSYNQYEGANKWRIILLFCISLFWIVKLKKN
jgi:hypothetical protein